MKNLVVDVSTFTKAHRDFLEKEKQLTRAKDELAKASRRYPGK